MKPSYISSVFIFQFHSERHQWWSISLQVSCWFRGWTDSAHILIQI